MAGDKDYLDFSNVQKITEIRHEALDEEFRRFPGVFAFWATQEAESRGKVLVTKAQMEQTYAKLATEHRGKADYHKIKVTEGQIEEKVTQEPDYMQAKVIFNKAQGDALRISAVVNALEKKGDMLKQLGFTRSQELARLSDSVPAVQKK